ncbi:MAG: caspase family protein, partial [Bacteroidales bacterium]
MKKLLILCISVLLIPNVIAQNKRLALVIGNSNYIHGGTLANPENDADAITEKLIELGFNVLSHKNVDQKSMQQMIDDFGIMLRHYDVGLFFFAGHGIQAKGTNYLIPVDADIRTENDIEYDCVKAGRLLAKMEDAGSKVNIMILDACRDNPFERQWTRSAAGKGLAFMNSPVGTLIAYSTAPGTTALDGYERNSPYTAALINHISQPNITILQMFQQVRKDVRETTNNMQIPWESTSLEGNFYFRTTKDDNLTKPP